MIEKKTIRGILNSSIEGKAKITMTDWLIENENKEWVSVESLLPKLIEADNKLTPIQTKVALKRIIKELEKKE
jgi:hypothetical protein